jgi:hypothetical protein
MTGDEMLQRFEILTRQKIELVKKKNNDYAKTQDAFSNFRFCADFAGISVKQVFMVFMAVKYARLKELFNGKEVKNENIADTLNDLANYSDLLNIYLSEKENAKNAYTKNG